MKDKEIEKHFRKGTFKSDRGRIKDILTRATGPDGKLYHGPAGKALQEKQRAKANYYRRNK